MDIQIPDFLLEMSKQLNTQGNRITADPIWMVCYDKEYPTAEDWGEYYVWLDAENEYHQIYDSRSEEDESGNMLNYLIENHEEWIEKHKTEWEEDEVDFDIDDFEHTLPNHITKIWQNKKMEVVKACLTEADAKYFIKRKQHDYPKLYTYVYSMCYCPQMIELRNWIKGLNSN